jgi:hypothetical protein
VRHVAADYSAEGNEISTPPVVYPFERLELTLQEELKKGFEPSVHPLFDIIKLRQSCETIPFYTERYLLQHMKKELSFLLPALEQHPDQIAISIAEVIELSLRVVDWDKQLYKYLDQIRMSLEEEADDGEGEGEGEGEGLVRVYLTFLDLFESFLQQQLKSLQK